MWIFQVLDILSSSYDYQILIESVSNISSIEIEIENYLKHEFIVNEKNISLNCFNFKIDFKSYQ